jgi:hypothetical protein
VGLFILWICRGAPSISRQSLAPMCNRFGPLAQTHPAFRIAP